MPTLGSPARAIKGHHLFALTGLRLIELTLSVVVDRVNSVMHMWITKVKDKARLCGFQMLESMRL